VQLDPLPFLAVQAPLAQYPLSQSLSAAQVGDLQAVIEAQATPPWQPLALGIEQVPAPLQVPAGVSRPPLQTGDPQLMVDGAYRQPPFPSQVPSRPQAAASMGQTLLDEPPAPTGLQAPVAQVMQVPEHAVAQQVPETQLACVHWSFAVQADPSEKVAAQVLPLVQ
jgi:hypothetical protein